MTERASTNCNDELDVDMDVICERPKEHDDWHEGVYTKSEVSIIDNTGVRAIGFIQWRLMTKQEIDDF